MEYHIDPARVSGSGLRPVAEKVLAGERLDRDDGVALYRTPDILGLGRSGRRRPTNGRTAIGSSSRPTSTSTPPTSASSGRPASSAPSPGCPRRTGPIPGRWTRSITRPRQARGAPTREFHIVGGLHPKLPLELLHRHDPRAEGAAPGRPHQGADRRGDRPPGADREELRSEDAPPPEGRRARLACPAAGRKCSAPPSAPPSPIGS